ncbi:MAG: cytochrome c3 family protein, partial [Bacteroidota bacterium]
VGISLGMAQLSPGDLTQAHAELEGLRNCTLCHDLGNKVSSQKCLDCHKDIQSLLDGNHGYHANQQVRAQECIACHSEHHGRKFDMVRFDEENFDHTLTGYALEAKHEVADCRACHQPEYIADAEIRQRDGTFLGLGQECLSCHQDYHQGTLSEDCASCHNIEGFRPAPNFDHDEANFALRGAHETTDCAACHEVSTRNGQEFQEFVGLEFENCVSCHDNPHNSRAVGTCTQCHNETSFERFLGQNRFNHNRTDFELRGSHQETECFACHAEVNNPRTIFMDQADIEENNCISCHEDYHESKYGLDCVQCHQEESFLALRDLSFFDHTITDYPLEGQHQQVDCRQCHEERYSTPIDFSACNHCHTDYHEEQFTRGNDEPDCAACHSLEEGFDYTLYTLEQHQESSFPLEGAHLATPCFACHLPEGAEKWSFREIGSECVDCHQNIHEGYISQRFYPEEDCQSCHSNEAWYAIAFDHTQTDWPLTGQHLEVDCRECHWTGEGVSYTQLFQGLGTDCVSCHENIHGDQFATNGVTDCQSCHITESWFPELFDHNQTDFPLDGRHAEVACHACHLPEEGNGTTPLTYQIETFECIDCHQ